MQPYANAKPYIMNNNILISGAGIAGLALAYWLKKYGFNPTVIEQSPKLREGGYAIDFFGAGFDVAEKMQLLPDLEKVDLKIRQVVFVDENNTCRGGMDAYKIRRLVNGRFYNLLRSDLSKVMYDHLDKDIQIIFGDTISNIDQKNQEVVVTFKSGKVRNFDLVAGADGLHSNVRNLVFGEESAFEKYFGYYVSSFTTENYTDSNDSFVSYNVPKKQVSIYSSPGNKLTSVFIFSSAQKLKYDHHDIEKQKQILRDEFMNFGWECPALLERLYTTTDFYFDPISQIKMKQWTKERVTLVGDAASCPSLLSGQGSTMAMVGAYVLAGELKAAAGDYNAAFRKYENIMMPLIETKQKLAQSFAGTLIPKSRFGIWIRNTFGNVMFSSLVAKWFVKKYMTDKIDLKDYQDGK
jgi:2-polyprenyl-6-methoxyphenol hydroxylase-like FAD-dependent oxidoreductase